MRNCWSGIKFPIGLSVVTPFTSRMECTLSDCLVGSFLVTSRVGHPQPHWTGPCCCGPTTRWHKFCFDLASLRFRPLAYRWCALGAATILIWFSSMSRVARINCRSAGGTSLHFSAGLEIGITRRHSGSRVRRSDVVFLLLWCLRRAGRAAGNAQSKFPVRRTDFGS